MQKFMLWWCDLIGVTDPNAIQIATGVGAAGILILAILFLFNGIFWSIGPNVTPARREKNSN